MNIKSLIDSNPEAAAAYAANDDQVCVDVLNAPTITVRHAGRKQPGDVMEVLVANGIDPEQVLAAVQSGSRVVKSFLAVLEGQGADFSTDGNQFILSQYPDPKVREVLLGIGRSLISPARQTIGRDATARDIDDTRAEDNRTTLKVSLINAYNAAIAAIEDGSVQSVKDVRQVLDLQLGGV